MGIQIKYRIMSRHSIIVIVIYRLRALGRRTLKLKDNSSCLALVFISCKAVANEFVQGCG